MIAKSDAASIFRDTRGSGSIGISVPGAFTAVGFSGQQKNPGASAAERGRTSLFKTIDEDRRARHDHINRSGRSTYPEEISVQTSGATPIIGNGFPHFSHLIGKAILVEAVAADANRVDSEVYRAGIASAVADSYEELRSSYDAATQRGEDYFKHLIWALAHSDVVDIRIGEWLTMHDELAQRLHWSVPPQKKLKTAISNFKSENYGCIVTSTPARYGTFLTRYRYKRFASSLMRGHVRLQAEKEGVTLGHQTEL